MRKAVPALLPIVTVLAAVGSCAMPAPDAQHFTVAALGLTVSYPSDWHRLGTSADILTIARPEMDFHGPIQPQGQARIVIGPPPVRSATVRQALAAYAGDARIVSTGHVDLRGGGPCDTLDRETLKEDVVPPENDGVPVRNIVTTVLACATAHGVLVGSARVWEDDSQRARADAVLLGMMRSLRLAP